MDNHNNNYASALFSYHNNNSSFYCDSCEYKCKYKNKICTQMNVETNLESDEDFLDEDFFDEDFLDDDFLDEDFFEDDFFDDDFFEDDFLDEDFFEEDFLDEDFFDDDFFEDDFLDDDFFEEDFGRGNPLYSVHHIRVLPLYVSVSRVFFSYEALWSCSLRHHSRLIGVGSGVVHLSVNGVGVGPSVGAVDGAVDGLVVGSTVGSYVGSAIEKKCYYWLCMILGRKGSWSKKMKLVGCMLGLFVGLRVGSSIKIIMC